MLEELMVDGYALIEKLHVAFSPGLNVLSGETGAGKSILIGAVGLILGRPGDVAVVRSGRDECTVTGVVRVESHRQANEWLDSRQIVPEDGTVIIRRSVKTTGRGAIYIQSVPSTRADLQELTSLLFDVHGQHEHQSLLRVATHRELIDRFGGHEEDVRAFQTEFSTLSEKKKQLAQLDQDEREQIRERDILAFAVEEIEKAALEPGEEEKLTDEAQILAQHEKLVSRLTNFHERLAESRNGALAAVRAGLGDLKEIGDIVERLGPYHDRLESVLYELEDIVESVRHFQNSVEFSSQRLELVEERLAEIRRLEKKYGAEIADVLEYARTSREKLDRIENWDEHKRQLKQDISVLEKTVWSLASNLSQKRRVAARELEQRIQANLIHLGMPEARFSIRVSRKESAGGKPSCGPFGIDEPEFLISPNKGEPVRPLRSIASGGEMSRIMLAIKSVLSEIDLIQSMIFDEIDAGIGGQVAIAVGRHLRELAERKQVLCITHLATIAVQGDTHIYLSKEEREGRTVTTAGEITGGRRIDEIARMLSGDVNDETARSHAEEMLAKAGR